MAKYCVNTGRGAFHEIEKGPGVEIGLLVEEVEFGAKGLLARCEVRESLGLEPWGKRFIVKLELGGKDIDGIPTLGKGQACMLKRSISIEEALELWATKKFRPLSLLK